MAVFPTAARRYTIEVNIGGRWRRLSSPRWRGYGGVSLLAPKKGRRYGTFDAAGVAGARAWARSKRFVRGVRVVLLNPWPNLVLDTDTGWPDVDLCNRLQRIGRRLSRRLKIREGTRSHAQQAALFEQNMIRPGVPKPGRPLTAAPGTSNHEDHDGDGYGEAADVGVLRPGESVRNMGVNIAQHPGARPAMRAFGTCCPVPGETWHVERGDTWRA